MWTKRERTPNKEGTQMVQVRAIYMREDDPTDQAGPSTRDEGQSMNTSQMDQPGPSNCNIRLERKLEETGRFRVKLTPTQLAYYDAAENISMAGLREAMTENLMVIRVMFLLTVASFLGFSVYFTYGVVMEWKTAGYTTDVQDVYGLESMPISNITICADVNVNQTHVRRNITVPAKLAEKVENSTGYTETEFMDYFIKFITLTVTARDIPYSLIHFFRMLMEANPQTSAFTDFLRSSYTPCRSMLQSCKLDGVSFDCCQNSVTILDDSGLCYQITMSHDESSLHQSPLTRHQVVPGVNHGLTLEVKMDLGDILWLERDMSAGFKVYLAPVGFPPLQSPLIAPSAAETFIQVTASERSLTDGCLMMGQTPVNFGGSYYDSHGDMCAENLGDKVFSRLLNCHWPNYHNDAEQNEQCGPQSNYLFNMIFSRTDEVLERNTRGQADKSAVRAVAGAVHLAETGVRNIARNRQCPRRCRYWEYSGSASYVDLDPENSTAWKNGDVLYSRINIYYADFAYRQYSEAPAVSRYTAFCNFGNVIGLYLGLSVVGIAEIFFWFGKLVYVIVREKHRIRNRVEPLVRRKRNTNPALVSTAFEW